MSVGGERRQVSDAGFINESKKKECRKKRGKDGQVSESYRIILGLRVAESCVTNIH